MKAFSRIQQSSALLLGSRRMNKFNYPHSFTGVNSSMLNIP